MNAMKERDLDKDNPLYKKGYKRGFWIGVWVMALTAVAIRMMRVWFDF